MSRSGLSLAITAALVLALAGLLAIHSGWARVLFHEVYQALAGVEVLGPSAERDPPIDSPYQRWLGRVRAEIPLLEGGAVSDVATSTLRPWPQKGEGISGLYLRLPDEQIMDARLLELPPGGATVPERHLYEKGIYFLGGPGHTEIDTEGSPTQRVDWREGSLLSIPLNTRYRHINDSDSPVRLLAVTTFPFVLNSFDSEAFIGETAFAFEDRYNGSGDFFERERYVEPEWLESNFVLDIRDASLTETTIRGAGNRVMHWIMAGNQMLSLHVSRIPPRKYKKAHRHSNGSAFLILSGTGYTLAWPARAEHRRRRFDFGPRTFFAPQPYWYHQHFNPGSEPVRYLSINTPDLLKNLGLRFTDQIETRQLELQEAFERERDEADRDQQ